MRVLFSLDWSGEAACAGTAAVGLSDFPDVKHFVETSRHDWIVVNELNPIDVGVVGVLDWSHQRHLPHFSGNGQVAKLVFRMEVLLFEY